MTEAEGPTDKPSLIGKVQESRGLQRGRLKHGNLTSTLFAAPASAYPLNMQSLEKAALINNSSFLAKPGSLAYQNNNLSKNSPQLSSQILGQQGKREAPGGQKGARPLASMDKNGVQSARNSGKAGGSFVLPTKDRTVAAAPEGREPPNRDADQPRHKQATSSKDQTRRQQGPGSTSAHQRPRLPPPAPS